MESITLNLAIDYGGKFRQTSGREKWKEIRITCGISWPLLEPSIYYGEFVRAVYRRSLDFNITMFNAPRIVRVVKLRTTMINMCSLV